MRIALITEVFLPAVDGVVTRLRHTLEELRRAGEEVLVVAPAGGPPDYAGAKVVAMPGLRMPLYPDGVGYPDKRVSLPGGELGDALRRRSHAAGELDAVDPRERLCDPRTNSPACARHQCAFSLQRHCRVPLSVVSRRRDWNLSPDR